MLIYHIIFPVSKGTFLLKINGILHHGVVYQITCSCGLRYIGETSRCLKVRFDEHCKREGTNMTEVEDNSTRDGF